MYLKNILSIIPGYGETFIKEYDYKGLIPIPTIEQSTVIALECEMYHSGNIYYAKLSSGFKQEIPEFIYNYLNKKLRSNINEYIKN